MPAKKKNENQKEDNRKRVFAFFVYPSKEYIEKLCPDCQYDGAEGYGTAEEGWIDTLKGTMWKGFVSPLHYKDMDGEHYKKPHWHVILMFGQNAKKDWDTQIKPVLAEFLGNSFTNPVVIQSTQGYARYLCHIDNPEKAQYDKQDVIAFGGADYMTTINCVEDNTRIQKEIILFIKENNVLYFNNLVDWCMLNNEEWYYFLSKNCYFIREYLKAKHAETKSQLAEQCHVLTHAEYEKFIEYQEQQYDADN